MTQISATLRAVLIAAGLVALAAPTVSSAQDNLCHGPPGVARLRISVEGVRSSQGQVAVTLYGDDKRKFLHEELSTYFDPAKLGITTVCLSLPHPGAYAVVAYHDANNNRDLDVGLLGPREGYAFSNNVRPVLSAPSFDSAKIEAGPGDTILRLRLRYP